MNINEYINNINDNSELMKVNDVRVEVNYKENTWTIYLDYIDLFGINKGRQFIRKLKLESLTDLNNLQWETVYIGPKPIRKE